MFDGKQNFKIYPTPEIYRPYMWAVKYVLNVKFRIQNLYAVRKIPNGNERLRKFTNLLQRLANESAREIRRLAN